MRHLLPSFRSSRPRARLMSIAPALVVVGLLASAILSGCGAAGGGALSAASVNGQSVSLAAYQRMLSIYEVFAAQQGQTVSWQTPTDRATLGQVQQTALDFLISAQLAHQQIQQLHLTVDPKVVTAANKQLASQVQSLDTPGSAMHTMAVAAAQAAKQNPAKVDLAALIGGSPSVADAFMLLGYSEVEQSTLVAHVKVPQAHLRAIEVASQKQADSIENQITQHHADFGALAKQYSLDTQNASSGGEYGTVYVGQLSQIDPSFDRAIFGPRADYHAKTSYVTVPYQGKFILLEITQRATIALSSLTDPQAQQNTYTAWFAIVIRPAATIQQYVAVDATPTPAPALGG